MSRGLQVLRAYTPPQAANLKISFGKEEIVKMCHVHEEEGVDRFSIVTSGRALTGEEFDKAIHAYETMKKECKIDLCASMGFVTHGQTSPSP